MELKKRIDLAYEICHEDKKGHDKYTYVYPFTTENISGYIDYLDCKGKDILTVGSSGDQVLNMIKNDAKRITLIDICPFAKDYLSLKLAALEYMDIDTYLDFFCYKKYYYGLFNNRNSFNHIEFMRLLDRLIKIDDECFFFWHKLYKDFSGLTIRKHLFLSEEYNTRTIKKINPYLNDLKSLRNNLNKPILSVINASLFDYEFNHDYDVINLSNIGAKISSRDYQLLVDKMFKYLNDGGIMLANYLYDTDEDFRLREHIPASELIDIRGLNSYDLKKKEITDSVVLVKKLKKF